MGENVYQQGIVDFKLKVESFQDNHSMMVGIVKADVVPPTNTLYGCRASYKWPGSYMDGYSGWMVKYGKTGHIQMMIML